MITSLLSLHSKINSNRKICFLASCKTQLQYQRCKNEREARWKAANTFGRLKDVSKSFSYQAMCTTNVQAQEEGFLSKILVEEGKEVKVNEPVAIMCELEESLREIEDAKSAVDDLLRDHGNLRKLTWQSYLKEGSNEGKGCS